MGRPPGKQALPSAYDPELIERLLALVAAGKTLQEACDSDEAFPDASTFRRWTYDNVEGFAARFSRARELGVHAMIDQTILISDDSRNDTETRYAADGTPYDAPNNEWIQRSKLRVDTRKWLASKIVPKIYGERIQNEVSGPNGGPVTVSWLAPGTAPKDEAK